jgi:hypothetical protein
VSGGKEGSAPMQQRTEMLLKPFHMITHQYKPAGKGQKERASSDGINDGPYDRNEALEYLGYGVG